MEYKDLDNQYKWDLTLIYKDPADFDTDMDKARKVLTQMTNAKDTFTTNPENLLAFLDNEVTLDRLVSKMYCFAHLHADVEPANQDWQALMSRVLTFNEEVTKALDFTGLSIIKAKDNVSAWMTQEEFAPYRFKLSQVLREEEHLLSQEMETLLGKVSSISDVSSRVFDAMRPDYDDVIVDGEPQPLNPASLNAFLEHPDQDVRRQAYQNFYKEYKRFENVYAQTLSGVMKKDAFYADVRKFKDPLAASQWNDDVPEELFYIILKKANEDYRPLFHKYNALKKKLLKLDTLWNYDLFTPLVDASKRKFTIEECWEIILDVTSVFGEEYTNIIKQARKEHWIDFMPADGKRMGAYSSGCYDTRPYILTNFIGNYDSLSTMIHELGHSCHTFLSSKYQHPATSDYRIFVAEVASTVNETLLINYMLDHAGTKEEEAYYLYEFLENCVGLIFRQPMYAQFEDTLHQWASHDEPMNAARITELYDKINADYYGPDVKNDPLVGHSCFYIPHFYYNYYVYKYTLGMSVALAIVSRIQNHKPHQVGDYLEFLKSGGSDTPLGVLAKAGVNPLEDNLYDDAFNYFGDILARFEKIMDESA